MRVRQALAAVYTQTRKYRVYERFAAVFLMAGFMASMVLPPITSYALENQPKPEVPKNTHTQKLSEDELNKPMAQNYAGPLKSEPAAKAAPLGTVDQSTREEYLAHDVPLGEHPTKKPDTSAQPDAATEDVSKRSAHSKTYRKADGTRTTEYYATPQAYKDGSQYRNLGTTVNEDTAYEEANKVAESWLDRLLPGSPQPVGFKGAAGPLSAQFKTLRDDDGVTIRLGGKEISARPVGAREVKPETKRDKDTDSIMYKDVWEGVDLVYQYRGDHVKEYVIINKPTDQTNFSFQINGGTVRASTERPGTVEVWKGDQPLLTLPELSVNLHEKGFVETKTAYKVHGNTVTVIA